MRCVNVSVSRPACHVRGLDYDILAPARVQSPAVASARLLRFYVRRRPSARRRLSAFAGEPKGREEADADDDAPWIQDVTDKYILPDPESTAKQVAAEQALRARRRLMRVVRLAIVVSYLAAVSVLLYFTPTLRHVLRATPKQVALGMLALYTIELGYRCDSGVRNSILAFRRAEIEATVQAELGGDNSGAGDIGQQGELAVHRTRHFLTALAAAAAIELTGAAMAATAPVLAPGVLLLCLAQLPLRMCDWQPDEDGIVVPIPEDGRTHQMIADVVLLACALLLSVYFRGPLAVLAAGGFSLAALWQIAEVRRIASISEAALFMDKQSTVPPTPVRFQ